MTALLHDPEFFAGHDNPNHPENATRLSVLPQLISEQVVPWRAATDEELLAAHTPEHLQRVASKSAAGGGMLDPDTYCCPKSEFIARAAAGGLVDLSLGVESGVYRNGLALTRPPGHHATANEAMGFCLYNSVAVAATALRSQGVPRVAIVDFDVHHGNGTQRWSPDFGQHAKVAPHPLTKDRSNEETTNLFSRIQGTSRA
jgi:acetoin utilization deacetylase AcuC-like enzyme